MASPECARSRPDVLTTIMQRVSAPSRLGRYPVRRRIGAGAFATVWLAYDEQLDCPVAIKVLADNWTQDLHVRQRFLEEGRFLRKVESPHVVSVYDAGELADDRPFLVMSYADQGTLADRLELGALSANQAVHVVAQVGEGLSALHRRGVLHRDVKPANVLFRTVEDGESLADDGPRVSAMLGDLGLGKAMDMSSRLTMIGGTPSYVAPEQARGEGLDARADQYSLAAVTYLLLEGRPAFQHASLSAAADPGPPPPMRADLPPGVEAVVRRGLAADREHRYPYVRSYVAALREAMGDDLLAGGAPQAWIPVDPDLTRAVPRPSTFVAGSGGQLPPGAAAAPESGGATRRRRWPWALAGVAALALGVVGGYAARELAITDVRVTDAMGQLSVEVPEAWTADVKTDPWTPPEQDLEFPSLSVGETAGWQERGGSGVFVGVLPGSRLPEQVPQHDECGLQRSPVSDETDGDASVTVLFTGCAGDTVTVERVVAVNNDQLLWVQVRADSTAAANRVLEGVAVHGM